VWSQKCWSIANNSELCSCRRHAGEKRDSKNIIAQDPSEKNDLAAANPDGVSALQKRVNKLSAKMAKSPLLEMEMQAMLQRIATPAAFPGEEFKFNQEN
jgi:hypothetical protein